MYLLHKRIESSSFGFFDWCDEVFIRKCATIATTMLIMCMTYTNDIKDENSNQILSF